MNEALKDFYQAALDPNAYARELKETGKRIVGYYCTYAPEEIILAAGAHPMRLFGTKDEISLADTHLQSYCCSLVRGGLEDALSGNLGFLSGTVFPHTCDTIQRLSDIWRLNTSFGFFADVVLPVKLDTPAAHIYMSDVLEKFRKDIATGLGVDISDEDLIKAIAKINRIRNSLQSLYSLRVENPSLISGRDMFAIVKGAMVMDRDLLPVRLEEVLEIVRNGELSWDTENRRKIMLVGGVCDIPDIYTLIEAAGGMVIADDLCMGSRSFEGLVGTERDPMAELTDRYISRPTCASKHASNTSRGERIVEMTKSSGAEGVIFLLLKFCDPHAFDYPYMKEFLDKAGIPNMLYELEAQHAPEGQLSTRFETFIQML